MGKISDMSLIIDELTACSGCLLEIVDAIQSMFTGEPESQPAAPAEPPEAEEPKKYTFAEVRKAFSAKTHAGYTEQVKALINSYGVDRLSAVDESDYPRLMKDLEAIT